MKRSLIILVLVLQCLFVGAQGADTKKVAILETVDKEGKVPYGVKLMVRSNLSGFITSTPGYKGYDRVDVSSILGEHNFQRSGLVSEKDLKRLGEMIGANYVLVAEAAYLNDSHIFLSAKILNVETAELEQTANVQSSTGVDDLEKNCKILAGKLLGVNVETGALRGELTLSDGKYVGEHVNGKPHGYGTFMWRDGTWYKGEFKNGERHGKGEYHWKNGNKYIGTYRNNERSGEGTYYWSDGSHETANYVDGFKDGYAVKYDANGKIVSKGYYKRGKFVQ